MSRLVVERFDRRFAELVEMGRAKLPTLAPDWTDHNAHDPGITLMELLAWVAEAQLYAVGRTRRDERTAYAALMSLLPAGTRAARGLVWPDLDDPGGPAAMFAQSVVVPADAVVHPFDVDTPTFRPSHRLLWIPGEVRSVSTRLADGRVVDHTAANRRGTMSFAPFGDLAGPKDVFALEFECRGDDGVFPASRQQAKGAYWTLGVRVPGARDESVPEMHSTELQAILVVGSDRTPVAIVSDTTFGLLRTGALVLDLSALASSPRRFTLELHAPRGLSCPPRVLHVSPNVVPVVQGRTVPHELHVATGEADWGLSLNVPGLRFAANEAPVHVEAIEHGSRNVWRQCAALREQGPDDRVFELDLASDRITFGNGINGRVPPEGAQVLVSYAVCDGASGAVARNRRWQVAGFEGVFGRNRDAVAGGAAPEDWRSHRRVSRERARGDHALVTADDIVQAARRLPLLCVDRAWVTGPVDGVPDTGVVRLVAMRSLRPGEETVVVPETRRWLAAVRRCLAPRMPLGVRLEVAAPRLARFTVNAVLESEAGRNTEEVRSDVLAMLRARLATTGPEAREPGIPVSACDLAGWLLGVAGVERVRLLGLQDADGRDVQEILVTRDGLPRLDIDGSRIDLLRASEEGMA